MYLHVFRNFQIIRYSYNASTHWILFLNIYIKTKWRTVSTCQCGLAGIVMLWKEPLKLTLFINLWALEIIFFQSEIRRLHMHALMLLLSFGVQTFKFALFIQIPHTCSTKSQCVSCGICTVEALEWGMKTSLVIKFCY
jgi:hypothetical protein